MGSPSVNLALMRRRRIKAALLRSSETTQTTAAYHGQKCLPPRRGKAPEPEMRQGEAGALVRAVSAYVHFYAVVGAVCHGLFDKFRVGSVAENKDALVLVIPLENFRVHFDACLATATFALVDTGLRHGACIGDCHAVMIGITIDFEKGG